jgi:hypothetical protein
MPGGLRTAGKAHKGARDVSGDGESYRPLAAASKSQPLVSLRHYIHGRNAGRNLQPIEIGVAGAAVPTRVPKQHEFVHADVGQSWELRKGATDFLEAGRIANSAIIWRSPTRPSPTKPLLKTPLIVPSAPSTNPPQAAAGQPENP